MNNLTEMEDEIARSANMLNLPSDWDGEGAITIHQGTWERAIQHLRILIGEANRQDKELPVPDIGPCGDGSIDLYWRESNFLLLINVQVTKVPTFYFEKDQKKLDGGVFDLSSIEFICKQLPDNQGIKHGEG